MRDLVDAFSGALLGLAIGDVLGCPVEGMREADIRARYGHIDGLVQGPEWPIERWRLPGLHSDDTQQALTLAEGLIRRGALRPLEVLAAWERIPRLDRRAGPRVYRQLAATYAALGRARDYEMLRNLGLIS